MQLEQLQSTQETLRTSQEVYEAVLAEARQLSVLEPGDSIERDAFYGEMGVLRTPLTEAHYDASGHVSYIKLEAQRSGSYKTRGAAYAVRRAHQQALERGVPLQRLAIASAGNAAKGVADAGNALGLETTAHVIDGASPIKVGNILAVGGSVQSGYDKLEAAMQGADADGRQDGVATIHAFDQVEVMAGQATVGFELVADLLALQAQGKLDTLTDPVKLFVPIGGGGLISGVACAVRWAKDIGLLGEGNVQVVGVQMQGCDAMNRAVKLLRRNKVVPTDLFDDPRKSRPFNGKADGVAVRTPGELTSKIVADSRFVADILLVSEGELGQAMTKLSRTHGTTVEPAGALSMAGALRYGKQYPATRRQGNSEHLVTITSGLNVDESTFDYFMQAAESTRNKDERRRQDALEQYRATLRALGQTAADSQAKDENSEPTNPEQAATHTNPIASQATVHTNSGRRLRVLAGAVLR